MIYVVEIASSLPHKEDIQYIDGGALYRGPIQTPNSYHFSSIRTGTRCPASHLAPSVQGSGQKMLGVNQSILHEKHVFCC